MREEFTSTTALLGTYDPGRAQIIGEQGLAAGFWTSFEVRMGDIGDDLIITYIPLRRKNRRIRSLRAVS
ncbi:hypothetical protein FB565_007407 [Actinoplanes lutulentus]|uniref:Uncharacterized protein n=1 Tax=Actinoplanes lutulentus TaxID=1287878 RepID=A0A327Z4X1_9ACTN|nr:hypothetical protein [Actinoplanes lutulentus]MBB2947636.1 hypothetical protein [Actinoplanes lutulentus]RAK27693.1 hypothetical protein B0I29_12276 [Actinoplanes lutulentus]